MDTEFSKRSREVQPRACRILVRINEAVSLIKKCSVDITHDVEDHGERTDCVFVARLGRDGGFPKTARWTVRVNSYPPLPRILSTIFPPCVFQCFVLPDIMMRMLTVMDSTCPLTGTNDNSGKIKGQTLKITMAASSAILMMSILRYRGQHDPGEVHECNSNCDANHPHGVGRPTACS